MVPADVTEPTDSLVAGAARRTSRRLPSVANGPRVLAAAIVAALVLALGAWSGFNYFDSINHLSRGSVPGAVEFASDPGRVVVYYEGHLDPSLGELNLRVTGPDGSAVRVEPFPYDLRYDVGRLGGHAVAFFDAATEGRYVVTSTHVEAGGRLAAGVDLGPATVLMVVALIAVLFTLVLGVVVALAVVLTRRTPFAERFAPARAE